MKLLAQTNRRYLLVSMAALALGSGALFLGVRGLFDHNVEERLTQLQTEIEAYVKLQDTLPVFFQNTGSMLVAQKSAMRHNLGFGDTLLFNEIEQEEEPYDQMQLGL